MTGLRGYFQHLSDTRNELAILVAGALLVLVFAEPLLMAIFEALAPGFHAMALGYDPVLRRWIVGLLPALLLLLGVPWMQWRRLRREAWTGEGFIYSSATQPIPASIDTRDCEELFAGIQRIRAEIPRIPVEFDREQCAALHRWPERFDPQRWLEVFDKVRALPSWRLDFVYHHWGNGGAPTLYLRGESDARFDTREALLKARGSAGDALLKQIAFEPTALGFFQFAVFMREAPRFYLHWHSQSDDFEYLYTEARLEEILDGIPITAARQPGAAPPVPGGLTTEERAPLASLDLQPKLVLLGTSAELTLIAYTQFGGFSRVRMRITWPNKIEALGTEVIVPYRRPMVY